MLLRNGKKQVSLLSGGQVSAAGERVWDWALGRAVAEAEDVQWAAGWDSHRISWAQGGFQRLLLPRQTEDTGQRPFSPIFICNII